MNRSGSHGLVRLKVRRMHGLTLVDDPRGCFQLALTLQYRGCFCRRNVSRLEVHQLRPGQHRCGRRRLARTHTLSNRFCWRRHIRLVYCSLWDDIRLSFGHFSKVIAPTGRRDHHRHCKCFVFILAIGQNAEHRFWLASQQTVEPACPGLHLVLSLDRALHRSSAARCSHLLMRFGNFDKSCNVVVHRR